MPSQELFHFIHNQLAVVNELAVFHGGTEHLALTTEDKMHLEASRLIKYAELSNKNLVRLCPESAA